MKYSSKYFVSELSVLVQWDFFGMELKKLKKTCFYSSKYFVSELSVLVQWDFFGME